MTPPKPAPDQIALSEVLAAAGDAAQNARHSDPTKRSAMRGPMSESTISAAAHEKAADTWLWLLTEELLDISWNVS